MIHPTAEVSDRAVIGKGTKIWNHSQVRERAEIGKECILGKNVYIDEGVIIGDRVKIQNNSSIYKGTVIEDGVFIGPNVVFVNDKHPRAVTEEGELKTTKDWELLGTIVRTQASIGAGVVILCEEVGAHSVVGAGAVVVKNVNDYQVVVGNPAKPL